MKSLLDDNRKVLRIGIACWMGAIILCERTPAFVRWVTFRPPDLGASSSGISLFNKAADPKIGHVVAIPTRDSRGHPIEKNQPVLLVLAGTCSDCSLSTFDPRKVQLRPGTSLVVIYQSAPENLSPKLLDVDPPKHVVGDEQGNLALELNAAWRPRLYMLNAAHKITAMQESSTTMPPFVTYEN